MVGVEQGPYVAGKLVKPGQPHPLLSATIGSVASFAVIITFFVVQLWKKEEERTVSLSCLCGTTGKLDREGV